MIVSASRRTDIPAFYGEWFMNRIRDGFVLTQTPFRTSQVRRVSLEPEHVDAIVFWTRNGDPLLHHLDELDRRGFRYYFLYTLVHYPRAFERFSGPLSQKLERFKRLSQKVGPDRIVWRYDPIILSNVTDSRYHYALFEEIAAALAGFTRRCIISFLDIYAKTRRLLDRLQKESDIRVINVHDDESKIRHICSHLSQVSSQASFEIFTCAEPFNLLDLGILQGRCIDDKLLNRLFGLNLPMSKDKGQRKLCRCVESKDIGVYDTCPHGCVYCYANTSYKTAQANFRKHDKYAPLLLSKPPMAGELQMTSTNRWIGQRASHDDHQRSES